ncbi:flagellar motor switch protein FliN [Cellulomonas soli]|uniref:flagellar motor switch protein FliN n=1 Tax=Cellulomonas soli TaxID=931535 RepID=UPI003F82CEE4
MNTTLATAELAARAAQAAAVLVPSTVPLTAVPAAGEVPASDAVAIVASFVGSPSAELAIIAGDAVTDAIAAGQEAGAALGPAEALRPALEAATHELGAGVLDTARTETTADVIGADTELFALQHEGVTLAWFAVRLRGPQVTRPTANHVPSQRASMRVLYDVEMTLTAEIGRTRLPVRQVLDLTPGAILELDRTAGSPADIMVNGRLIARGEVVVVDEDYGVRITEIVAGTESVG